MGIISSAGRGLEAFRNTLAQGLPAVGSDGVHRVQDKDLKDPVLAKDARRAGRFDRMVILSGLDALKDAGMHLDNPSPAMGLIVATGLGPHGTTFRFLDDILNYKEKDVSPTLFSHSVHNAAASYLSLLAGLRGPTLTVTRFSYAFDEALSLARCWLDERRCGQVLVGAVDELGPVMEEVLHSRTAANVRLGEGSVFLVLGPTPSRRNYGTISSVCEAVKGAFGNVVSTEVLFGRQPCPSAMNYAAAALLLSDPKVYKSISNNRDHQ